MMFSSYHPLRPNAQPVRESEWITIEVAGDRAELLVNAEKLELAWPDRYDTKIQPRGDSEFCLAVRHRD